MFNASTQTQFEKETEVKKLAFTFAVVALQGCAVIASDALNLATVQCEAGDLYRCRQRAAVQIVEKMRTNEEAADEVRVICRAAHRRGTVKNPQDCDKLHQLVVEFVPGQHFAEPRAFR